MSKQATPPPPGDKPKPGGSAPPPPPAWRHWLLPIGIVVALFLWIFLPAVHQAPQTSLTYSQFLTDVSAHKVKTVTIAQPGGTSTGTLTSGTDYTVVIPSGAAGRAADQ
jgi:cell division protease FtsH